MFHLKPTYPCFMLSLVTLSTVADDESIYQLSLAELAQVQVESVSTLTATSQRMNPASTTFIDEQSILDLGASNFIALLNQYVPETQIITNKAIGDNPGFRGIAPSGPHAHQYLINGRSQSMRFFLGSMVESYNLLGDIHAVEVIHGPGSVVQGPGALTGIINVTTHNAMTFSGLELTAKKMFENESTIAELKVGHKVDNDSGFFAYIGFENQQGASVVDAPIRYSNSFTAINGQSIIAGEDANINASPYQSSPENDFKVYLDYSHADFNLWYRWSQESERLYIDRTKLSINAPDNVQLLSTVDPETLIRFSNSYVYETHALQASYRWHFVPDVYIDFKLGADIQNFDYDAPLPNGGERFIVHHEEEINGQVMLNWHTNQRNHWALGVEVSHQEYYFELNQEYRLTDPWSVLSYALLAEQQYNWSDNITSFIGVRVDKGRYSDYLTSPRIAIVYVPNETQTWKFIANKANRFAPELISRLDSLNGSDTTVEESLDSIEVSFHEQINRHFFYELRGYFQSLEAIDSVGGLQDHVGSLDTYGLTGIANYTSDTFSINVSHSWVDLYDVELLETIDPSNFTAAGQGFGDNLNAWSNNNTKINILYFVNEAWQLNTSINVLWDYPGKEELAQYNSFVRDGGPGRESIVIDEGYSEAFEYNIEWSMGIGYQLSTATTIRFDAYNLYGEIDDEHNRYQDRNYGTYRVKPLSYLLSFTHQFY